MIPTHNVEAAAKLEALRAAAQLGISDLDRGEFKEFADASALVTHLNKLADTVLSGTRGTDRPRSADSP
jgi:antitoxin ParD1/3/4